MKLFTMIKNFRAEEDGAVTVDWVVLTAAVVGLGVLALIAVRGGTETLTNNISDALGTVSVCADPATC